MILIEQDGLQHFPMTQILRNVWLGNITNGSTLSVANPNGITHVINLTGDKYAFAPGIHYLTEFHFLDGHEIPDEVFWGIVNHGVKLQLAEEDWMIHCHAGMSRSPILLAAILHHSGRLEFQRALDFIHRLRPITKPHPTILTSVRRHLKLWPYQEGWTRK